MHSLYRRHRRKQHLYASQALMRVAILNLVILSKLMERRPIDGSITESDLLYLVIPTNEELMIARETDCLSS